MSSQKCVVNGQVYFVPGFSSYRGGGDGDIQALLLSSDLEMVKETIWI